MLVYRLANYRNSISPSNAKVIPQRVIDRPPSAELRPDQKDSDSLPPYEVLDAILELFIEDDLSVDEITARGFDRVTVGRVLDMVVSALGISATRIRALLADGREPRWLVPDAVLADPALLRPYLKSGDRGPGTGDR